MRIPEIKLSWTETWTVEHVLELDEARAFVKAYGPFGVSDTATAEELVEVLKGMDLENGVAHFDRNDWTDANVDRGDVDVEQC